MPPRPGARVASDAGDRHAFLTKDVTMANSYLDAYTRSGRVVVPASDHHAVVFEAGERVLRQRSHQGLLRVCALGRDAPGCEELACSELVTIAVNTLRPREVFDGRYPSGRFVTAVRNAIRDAYDSSRARPCDCGETNPLKHEDTCSVEYQRLDKLTGRGAPHWFTSAVPDAAHRKVVAELAMDLRSLSARGSRVAYLARAWEASFGDHPRGWTGAADSTLEIVHRLSQASPRAALFVANDIDRRLGEQSTVRLDTDPGVGCEPAALSQLKVTLEIIGGHFGRALAEQTRTILGEVASGRIGDDQASELLDELRQHHDLGSSDPLRRAHRVALDHTMGLLAPGQPRGGRNRHGGSVLWLTAASLGDNRRSEGLVRGAAGDGYRSAVG